MCLYVDDEDAVTLHSGDRRARKEHRCRECRRTISPGERYRYWTILYDGRFTTDKMCAHCWATIEVGAAMTGCPKNWYWDAIFTEPADEGGFVADIIDDHPLTRRQTAAMRLCRYYGQHRWRRPDGTLAPIPAPVEPLYRRAA